MTRLQVGVTAPAFTLPSEEGERSLADYRGQWLVIYFYPRDFTPGCTQEACDFRDALANSRMDAAILGVSPDDVESHRRFRQEHGLNFLLLADEDNSVARAYGAYGEKNLYGKTSLGVIRSTFIVDPQGKVAAAHYNVKAAGHAEQVAEELAGLRS